MFLFLKTSPSTSSSPSSRYWVKLKFGGHWPDVLWHVVFLLSSVVVLGQEPDLDQRRDDGPYEDRGPTDEVEPFNLLLLRQPCSAQLLKHFIEHCHLLVKGRRPRQEGGAVASRRAASTLRAACGLLKAGDPAEKALKERPDLLLQMPATLPPLLGDPVLWDIKAAQKRSPEENRRPRRLADSPLCSMQVPGWVRTLGCRAALYREVYSLCMAACMSFMI